MALVLVVAIGLARDQSSDDMFLLGISLAIAAIPTGMPAVVTTLLSLGTQELAKRGDHQATPVCRDTGLDVGNLLGQDRHFDTESDDRPPIGDPRTEIRDRRRGVFDRGQDSARGRRRRSPFKQIMMPMALCCDAVVADGEIVGDPTEAALVVLAAKGGIDVDETRKRYPRLAEVPFDSAYKFMATFHEIPARTARDDPLLRQGRAGCDAVALSTGAVPDGSIAADGWLSRADLS